MVREFPAFHCDAENATISDVVSKIKVVEDSLGSFMKQSNEQLQALNDIVASLNTIPRNMPSNLIDLTETPGSKKRKIGEDVPGITPLAG